MFPAVALANGKGWLAVRSGDPRVAGDLIVYEWTGDDLAHAREIRRWQLKAGSPCFPDLYVFGGDLWLAYHSGVELVLFNLTTGIRRTFNALSNPTAFGGGYFAYTEPSQPYRVLRLNLRTGEVTQPRLGAPTGLSRILDDGTVKTIDEDRELEGPYTTNPRMAGRLTVYEYDDGGRSGCGWEFGPTLGLLWPGLLAFTPDVAAEGERFAIATAGSGSTRVFCGTFADLLATNAQPVPPVQPAPDPVPVPQPTPEPHMEVPQSEIDRAKAALSDLRNVLGFGPNQPPLSYVRAVAQRLGGKWGLNGKRGNANDPSGDILAYDFPGQQPQLYDVLIDGGGENKPTFDPLEYPQTAGAVWLSPGTSQPGPTPAPQPPPADSDPTLLDLFRVFNAYVTRAEFRQQSAEDRLTALEQRPAGDSSLPRRVAIRTDNGAYVSAEGGGHGEVNATREVAGGWEVFTLEPK